LIKLRSFFSKRFFIWFLKTFSKSNPNSLSFLGWSST
jgi:hypothetical protein